MKTMDIPKVSDAQVAQAKKENKIPAAAAAAKFTGDKKPKSA